MRGGLEDPDYEPTDEELRELSRTAAGVIARPSRLARKALAMPAPFLGMGRVLHATLAWGICSLASACSASTSTSDSPVSNSSAGADKSGEKSADEKAGAVAGQRSEGNSGGLGIADSTASSPSVILDGRQIIIESEQLELTHDPKFRLLPFVREQLPQALELSPVESGGIRFASHETRPYLIRIAPEVQASEYASALISAGFAGLPVARVEPHRTYLYVRAATPPGMPPLHARFRWPERALLVRLRAESVELSRISVKKGPLRHEPTGATDASNAKEQATEQAADGTLEPTAEQGPVRKLPADTSGADIAAALSQICTEQAPCSPFVIHPDPESRAAQLSVVLSAIDARPEFEPVTSAPPRALLLTGQFDSVELQSKTVRLGATEVNGRLPAEIIRRVVRERSNHFRFCYEKELQQDPDLEVTARMRFVIARDGTVSAVGGESSPERPTLVSCLTGAFEQLKFPKPEGGIVRVTYPLTFRPK